MSRYSRFRIETAPAEGLSQVSRAASYFSISLCFDILVNTRRESRTPF